MRCNTHRDAEAVAVCRGCSVGVCPQCAISASPGFVCSPACGERAILLDKLVDVSRERLARARREEWFVVPGLMIVVGSLLVGEHALFDTPMVTFKIVVGIFILVMGVSSALVMLNMSKAAR